MTKNSILAAYEYIQEPKTGPERGQNLRSFLTRHGFSTKRFAELSGIGEQTIHMWINGGKTDFGRDLLTRSSETTRIALMRGISKIEPGWTGQQARRLLGIPQEAALAFPWPSEAEVVSESEKGDKTPKQNKGDRAEIDARPIRIRVDEISGEISRIGKTLLICTPGGDGYQTWITETVDKSGKIISRIARIAENGVAVNGFRHMGTFQKIEPYVEIRGFHEPII